MKHIFSITYRIIFEVGESGRFQLSEDNPIASAQDSARRAGHTPTADIPTLGTFGEQHFQVDHPFLFFIWDYFQSYIVMIGRVTHPNALKNE